METNLGAQFVEVLGGVQLKVLCRGKFQRPVEAAEHAIAWHRPGQKRVPQVGI